MPRVEFVCDKDKEHNEGCAQSSGRCRSSGLLRHALNKRILAPSVRGPRLVHASEWTGRPGRRLPPGSPFFRRLHPIFFWRTVSGVVSPNRAGRGALLSRNDWAAPRLSTLVHFLDVFELDLCRGRPMAAALAHGSLVVRVQPEVPLVPAPRALVADGAVTRAQTR